jgi:hypothetical protein
VVRLPKELGAIRSAAEPGRWGWTGVNWKAERIGKQVEAEYDAETADAVAAAVASVRNPKPILERAEWRKTEAAERDASRSLAY